MGIVLGFTQVDQQDVAIGARLKRWRERRGVALDDLARRIDLSPDDARRAEMGHRHLNAVQIDAATRALHLPLWALMSDRPAY